MENLTGKNVDRYQILELLGQGGMAMVYKAYDPRLEREVAVKLIRLEAFPPEDLHDVRKRFEREAKALAQLSHPNIIKVMDYGEHEGSPFLVMEYLQGGTLKQMIGEPRSWQEAMQLLLPIARGLEYAHRRGVVHRDIKPANILVTENGEPTLSDFGIVKLFRDEKTALTASGAAIGTPEYMAPEQWTGKTSPKSDMYSLGVVLYELITGRRPYDADTPGGLFLKQVTEPLPLPREIVPGLPELVEQFLLKALDKEPSERHDNLGAFVREIENFLTAHSLQARSIDPEASKTVKVSKADADRKASLLPRTSRRWVSVVVVAIVLIGLMLGGMFGLPPLLDRPENTTVSTLTLKEKASQEPTQTVTSTAEISPTSEATSTPDVTVTTELGIGSSRIRPADGMVMMYIPAGEFMMGSEDGEKDERPIHAVYLDSFWIDQTELTNAMYAKCVSAGACNNPGSSGKDSKYDNFPVEFMAWEDAKTYCEWAGGRLPTEAEWEKAARGGLEGKKYPWGDEPPVNKPGAENGALVRSESEPVIEVKTFVPNGYGLYDMAGNAREYVNDWYDSDYYADSPRVNPQGPSSGEITSSGQYRVLRSGSWMSDASFVRNASRYWYHDENNGIGFRCVFGAAPISNEITDDFGVEMALVPAGEFNMGRDAGDALAECRKEKSDCPSERFEASSPQHQVYLDAFYIDTHEVTNALYKSCVDAGVCNPPQRSNSNSRSSYYGDSQFDDYPVIFVDWNMAYTYCKTWRGGGLPTEAQWEKAARGGLDGKKYPWGDDMPICVKGAENGARYFSYDNPSSGCSDKDTEMVGSYSPNGYGLYDMVGNVSEWVDGWYGAYPGSAFSDPSYGTTYRVLRGGGWDGIGDLADRLHNPPGTYYYSYGFRCARDATP